MTDVALITTVYNRPHYLAEAIESALAQSIDAFELLIWDDGSTDDTLEVARAFAARDPRVRVVAAAHQGRVKALNAAIAATDARFFGILDSDDRLAPEALAETVPVMASDPDIAVVYTDNRRISAQGEEIGFGISTTIPYSPERLLVDQMVFHFRLFRREIYDEVGGFDDSFDSAEDYDLVLRLSEVGEIVHVPKVLYDYRVHAQSLSVEGDLAQIEASARAIRAALARRGVADEIDLHVRLKATYALVPKEPPTGA